MSGWPASAAREFRRDDDVDHIPNLRTTMPNKSKKETSAKRTKPPQAQRRQPGIEAKMKPRPRSIEPTYRGSGKLHRRTAGGAPIRGGGPTGTVPGVRT